MTSPNAKQRELIENIDGLSLVDAGAGTGKTFTVTRRYAEIVAQDDVEPDDVLLITFTRNAATEMKDRIVSHCDYGMRALKDAPIQTFHSLCHDILEEHGFHAPSHLGIDDAITGSTQILENETIEREYFQEFIGQFSDEHEEYDDLFSCISDPSELLRLVTTLASKGVFPTADGWYRDCQRHLEGDFDAFREVFDELNQPRNGGSKQSELRSKLGRYGSDKCYLPEAPDRSELRGERGSKTVPDEVIERVFEEDREQLVDFVHDVYIGYLEFALRRNYLNFSFLQLFAFVLLCEDDELRSSLEFEYVMIDEFQDSSESQFKLALLLAGTDNICVVGDWKQSIYSFQYAAVENITEFESRLERFTAELNDDADRVAFPTDSVSTIELEQNYRSTQDILDFAEHALVTPASSRESVDRESILERIVSLSSNTGHEHSQIEAFQHEDEHEAILTKVQEIVDNDAYAIEEDGELRSPTYNDIAVLTRTRDFGRDLLSVAEEYEFPMAYEGGIELFRTDQAKLLLAWLRVLESNEDRGWAVVLERAGYTLDEIDHILDVEAYPQNMITFRTELSTLETITAITRRVFDRYGYDGSTADVVLTTIQSVHSATTMTLGDLIRFLEQGIDAGHTEEVNAAAGADAITVQTIHSVKGLEYPIVILGNMNSGKFPPSGGRSGILTYSEVTGLRQRKCYAEAHGEPHIYDNWRSDVLRRCQPTEYDEERRLLYVAITRAKDHLLFSTGADQNAFLEELPVSIESLDPVVEMDSTDTTVQSRLSVSIPQPDGPDGYSPHSLMSDDVYEGATDGKGMDFGSAVHDFAERYALGEKISPRNEDERNVEALLDSLEGTVAVEEPAYLPLKIDGERVTLSGIVDLVHITPDRVEIIDYKTDRGRHAESEYQTQLSAYYHALDDWFDGRDVTASLYYTADDTRVEIDPLSKIELVRLI
ncbi:UvrD-helicase domain-containing protein [Natronorubrum halophilum]|uniref:UvrD-helicase domain-containing protein n=1 Tax=Natronorubrum halophilum TaxID=1702106 RepID=UPI000EF6D5E6|nr:ATP-dependent DNA helicase [Natronorubrum halophilum]